MSDPAKAAHLARWLWSRPRAASLDLSACSDVGVEVPRLIAGALAAGALPTLTGLNIDGSVLPIRQIRGSEDAAHLDFSSMGLGVASGLVIASLLEANASLASLLVGRNALRDEAVEAIARALRANRNCSLATLGLSHTRLGVSAAKQLAEALVVTPSITSLDVTGNRLCGTWMDAYGAHGSYVSEGIVALAEALPCSSLRTLLAGHNGIRDEGALAIATAIRHEHCQVATLSLESNAIGIEGGHALAAAVETSSCLCSLDLGSNMLCGVATLATADGPRQPSPYTSSTLEALVVSARRSACLASLSLANNRICGTWSDAYGKQIYGAFVGEGVAVVAAALSSRATSPLRHLDISSNAIGPIGGKIVYEALRDNIESKLTMLDLRMSRLDPVTESHLRAFAQRRPTLTLKL